MARFSDLSNVDMAGPDSGTGKSEGHLPQAPCGGCGAKVSGDALSAVLGELRETYPQILAEADTLDDAMPLQTTEPLLQSLDALRGLVDDPWRMGRIAAQHALSDLYACGAAPHSALALVTLPFARPSLLHRDLHAVLDGALSVFAETGCKLQGGHSMQGPELQLGFAVNGVLPSGFAALTKRGAAPGNKLLLTKALGSGALFAAHMQSQMDGRYVESALRSMEQSNAKAAAVARQFHATAVTDVTGFGLAGHLLEMLGDSLIAEIDLDQVAVMPGALDAMASGVFSTLHEPNRQAVATRWTLPEDSPLAAELLFDPQTSGGLLIALSDEAAPQACEALRAENIDAALIGVIRASGAPSTACVNESAPAITLNFSRPNFS
ncbi:selenide, water dikinase SelD [Congregibacter brevis]